MKNKSEVPFLFSRFKAQVENLLSTTIKTLRTDGGTEYLPITKQFPHIIHQTTCPYTPEQNGLAERKHRHIIELTIAIMTHASLPPIFWDEICSSVVYLINRLPNHSGLITYTELLKKNPITPCSEFLDANAFLIPDHTTLISLNPVPFLVFFLVTPHHKRITAVFTYPQINSIFSAIFKLMKHISPLKPNNSRIL
jgi:hypothetical protein